MQQLSHVIELDPTSQQVNLFMRSAGIARFAFNWCLAEWQKEYRAGGKPNWMQLQKRFVSLVDAQFPWCRSVSSDTYYQPFRHVNQAFKNFFKRVGRYPRFKGKHSTPPTFKTGDVRQKEPGWVELPVLGRVRCKEDLRFDGRVISATVSADADRWTLSVFFELPDVKRKNTANRTVGVDLGLASFATFSDGTKVEAPKPLKANLKRLCRRSRRLSRKKKGSNRRKAAKFAVARLHRRIRNIRRDFLHNLSTKVVRENQTIALEDLSVSNMQKNRKLSRAIADVGWHEFKRQIVYKAVLHGRTVYLADRFFPSSKTCAECGAKHDALTLADRTFKCPHCGHEADRDVNAAINLRTLALRGNYARGEIKPLVLDGIAQAQAPRRNANSGVARKRAAKRDGAAIPPVPEE